MVEKHSPHSGKPAVPERTEGSTQVEPLTRGGYVRLPKVEGQIADAIALQPAALIKMAQCKDEHAPECLADEALVYFIRQHDRRGNGRVRDELIRALLARCTSFFKGHFRGFDEDTRKDLQGDVMKEVAEDLLAADDRGDYMQVRFQSYLKRRVIDVCRKVPSSKGIAAELQVRHQEHLIKEANKTNEGSLLAPSSPEAEPNLDTYVPGEGEKPTDIEQVADTVADTRLSLEELTMISEGLNTLPPKLRKAYLLRHYFDMNIGADKPANDPAGELTIAQYFGCTGRTVRSWLKEADRMLASLRENSDGK